MLRKKSFIAYCRVLTGIIKFQAIFIIKDKRICMVLLFFNWSFVDEN